MTARGCDFAGCPRPHHSHGHCRGHANQLRRTGTLKPIRAIRPKTTSTVRDGLGRKRCVICENWLAESEFYSLRQTSDGLNSHCKTCMKSGNLMRLFGLTREQFDSLLQAQGGGCAICSLRPEAGGRRFAVDHDRACCPGDKSCGACIRGVLCGPCNVGIGFLRENTEILAAAINYLEVCS